MSVCKTRIEGTFVKEATKFGHGGHAIVPDHWVGKTVRVTIIDTPGSSVIKRWKRAISVRPNV